MNPGDRQQEVAEQRASALLGSAFPDVPTLDTTFEETVMHQVRIERRSWFQRHRVFVTMTLYWLCAIALSGWMLGDVAPISAPGNLTVLFIIVPTVLACFGAVWVFAYRGRLRLADLLLRTVQP